MAGPISGLAAAPLQNQSFTQANQQQFQPGAQQARQTENLPDDERVRQQGAAVESQETQGATAQEDTGVQEFAANQNQDAEETTSGAQPRGSNLNILV